MQSLNQIHDIHRDGDDSGTVIDHSHVWRHKSPSPNTNLPAGSNTFYWILRSSFWFLSETDKLLKNIDIQVYGNKERTK